MLVVVEETAGLPFECAGCFSGSTRGHSFIVCSPGVALLMSLVFILRLPSLPDHRASAGCNETPIAAPLLFVSFPHRVNFSAKRANDENMGFSYFWWNLCG